jgi:glyoxalase/bleomycin resistance protein/dioxygenase superfamily protein
MKKKKISSRRAAIPVRALDFVMYSTKNTRRARAFYQKLFGFKRGSEWNDFWSEFATEPLTLCINGTGNKRHPEWDWSGPACIALAVDDVRAAIDICRRRRVKIGFACTHAKTGRQVKPAVQVRREIARRLSSTTGQIEDYTGITTDGQRNGAATDRTVLDQRLFSLRSIDLE